jgi:hypothetical protein
MFCQETASGGCNTLRTLVCVCLWFVKCSSEWCVQGSINPISNPYPISSHTPLKRDNMITSLVGIRTKNHCAGEAQQQFRSQSIVDRPLLPSKRRHHFKKCRSLEGTKIWSWVPTGPETKTECAGQGQQQLTAQSSKDQCSCFPDEKWKRRICRQAKIYK